MFARVWKGTVRAEDGDSFAAVVMDSGFAEYARTEGNLGAWLLRRDGPTATEFVAFSLWESPEETAATYPVDARYLVDPLPTVEHYEVAATHLPAATRQEGPPATAPRGSDSS